MTSIEARDRWAAGWIDLCEKLSGALDALSGDARNIELGFDLGQCARLTERFAADLADVAGEGERPTVLGSLFRVGAERVSSDGFGGDAEARDDAVSLMMLAVELHRDAAPELAEAGLEAIIGEQARRLEQCIVDVARGPRRPAQLAA